MPEQLTTGAALQELTHGRQPAPRIPSSTSRQPLVASCSFSSTITTPDSISQPTHSSGTRQAPLQRFPLRHWTGAARSTHAAHMLACRQPRVLLSDCGGSAGRPALQPCMCAARLLFLPACIFMLRHLRVMEDTSTMLARLQNGTFDRWFRHSLAHVRMHHFFQRLGCSGHRHSG